MCDRGGAKTPMRIVAQMNFRSCCDEHCACAGAWVYLVRWSSFLAWVVIARCNRGGAKTPMRIVTQMNFRSCCGEHCTCAGAQVYGFGGVGGGSCMAVVTPSKPNLAENTKE